jgi:hypothetical protein
MLDSKQRPVDPNSPLSRDILHLYDEFVEFNDYCAFLCDAFASVISDEEHMEFLDQASVQGFGRCSHWMKFRMNELKGRLKLIHEKSRR